MTPLVFECEGSALVGALHKANGTTGVLFVTGGLQTRAGPHRLFTALAEHLKGAGISAMRFDRRGVGDSDGALLSYDESGPDIAAAVAAFKHASPHISKIVGLGLCDGASALLLAGTSTGLDAAILLNPWAMEDGEIFVPSTSALGARYLKRLLNRSAWRRIFNGEIDILQSIRNLFARSPSPSQSDARALPTRLSTAITNFPGPVLVLLSDSDMTAMHFAATVKHGADVVTLPGADHTLTRNIDQQAALDAICRFKLVVAEEGLEPPTRGL